MVRGKIAGESEECGYECKIQVVRREVAYTSVRR
jgi:hypothetical protein